MANAKAKAKQTVYSIALVIIGFIIGQTVLQTVGFGYTIALILSLITATIVYESEAE